jgi:hypothetical protein
MRGPVSVSQAQAQPASDEELTAALSDEIDPAPLRKEIAAPRGASAIHECTPPSAFKCSVARYKYHAEVVGKGA